MYFSRRVEYIVLFLRIAMGGMFFYDGYLKLIDKSWSALPYIEQARTFEGFYRHLATSGNIWWVNELNIWGPILIGIALFIGFRTKVASVLGILLLILYYLPVLQFPYLATGGYIIDRHIIYALVLLLFVFTNAGEFWGLDSKVSIVVKT